MLRGLLREVGLAAASLLASIFSMTFLFFALTQVGLADPALSAVSLWLVFNIMPFTVGLGALVAVVQTRWSPVRPFQASLYLILAVGALFASAIGLWMGYLGWMLFFLLPGFALWGALSGWFARRRSAMEVSR